MLVDLVNFFKLIVVTIIILILFVNTVIFTVTVNQCINCPQCCNFLLIHTETIVSLLTLKVTLSTLLVHKVTFFAILAGTTIFFSLFTDKETFFPLKVYTIIFPILLVYTVIFTVNVNQCTNCPQCCNFFFICKKTCFPLQFNPSSIIHIDQEGKFLLNLQIQKDILFAKKDRIEK